MKWAQVGALAVSCVLVLLALPMEGIVQAMRTWTEGLGYWAPLAFSLVYGLAATALIPASALSLAAGAMFGLWTGTAAVWLGGSIAIALSFLIARYAARDRVEALAGTNPRFAAIDRAIGKQGWKIVALMRLSPVFPFGLQNYLFGVSAIRFWPCCLSSIAFIIPGVFMYVYAGYAGIEAAAAVGGSGTTDMLELGLQIAGLAATVVVTVLVARIAAKAIAEHAPGEVEAEASGRADAGASGPKEGSVLKLLIALACLAGGLAAYVGRESIHNLFFPPRVVMVERYAGERGTETFDHGAFGALLARHVDRDGLVDYSALAGEAAVLDEYVRAVGMARFENLGRDGKLALLINAYNAFTLQLVLEHYPIESIYAIPSSDRWDARRWEIAGGRYSLDQIEHVLIRPNFRDDRIHFALVCAALGCPILRREAYRGDAISDQLQRQAEDTHGSGRWFRYDEPAGRVWLTQVYSWYAEDFVQLHGSVLRAASRHSPALRQAMDLGRSIEVEWLPYDWTLNDQALRGAAQLPSAGSPAR